MRVELENASPGSAAQVSLDHCDAGVIRVVMAGRAIWKIAEPYHPDDAWDVEELNSDLFEFVTLNAVKRIFSSFKCVYRFDELVVSREYDEILMGNYWEEPNPYRFPVINPNFDYEIQFRKNTSQLTGNVYLSIPILSYDGTDGMTCIWHLPISFVRDLGEMRCYISVLDEMFILDTLRRYTDLAQLSVKKQNHLEALQDKLKF